MALSADTSSEMPSVHKHTLTALTRVERTIGTSKDKVPLATIIESQGGVEGERRFGKRAFRAASRIKLILNGDRTTGCDEDHKLKSDLPAPLLDGVLMIGSTKVSSPAPTSNLSEHKATPELMAAFSKRATEIMCDTARVLFQPGESGNDVYMVRSGEVVLTMPVSSAHAMGFRATAGSLVGLPATFSNEPYSMTALAEPGSVLEHMDRETFLRMLIELPTLAIDVLAILAAETRSARIAIVDLSSRRRGLKRKGLV